MISMKRYFKIHFSTPLRSDPCFKMKHHSAFSLVEVVVALGILSFAVVAIAGILPMAFKSSQIIMQDTDAALSAQKIISEIQAGAGANRVIITNPNGDTRNINLLWHANTNNYLEFNQNGEVNSFASSSPPNTSIAFYAQISVFTNTGMSNVSRLQVDITAPAAAPPERRITNSFVTLLKF